MDTKQEARVCSALISEALKASGRNELFLRRVSKLLVDARAHLRSQIYCYPGKINYEVLESFLNEAEVAQMLWLGAV
jgi:hypothetical protein